MDYVIGEMPDLSEGSCAGIPTDIFFPESNQYQDYEVRMAIAICNGCPVKEPCLEWALLNEPFGIWGGVTANKRKLMRRKVSA